MTKTEYIEWLGNAAYCAADRGEDVASGWLYDARVVAKMLPELRWRTGRSPEDIKLLIQWPDGEYDITKWYGDRCQTFRWVPLSDVLSLILPPKEPTLNNKGS